MKANISVMLVEDHAGYREVIARALVRDADLKLLSSFATAEIALRTVQDRSLHAAPDVILLDLNLPGMSGLDAIPLFRRHVPESKIIILTQSNTESDILRAIACGASGYLFKSSTVRQIKDGIRTVMEGGASIDPKVAKFLLTSLKDAEPRYHPIKSLSERELEILAMLAEGLLKKEISDRLGISVTTVAYHVKHIFEKLDVVNAPAAVAKGFQSGLLPTAR